MICVSSLLIECSKTSISSDTILAIMTAAERSCARFDCWLILLIMIPLTVIGISTAKKITIIICSAIFNLLLLKNWTIFIPRFYFILQVVSWMENWKWKVENYKKKKKIAPYIFFNKIYSRLNYILLINFKTIFHFPLSIFHLRSFSKRC